MNPLICNMNPDLPASYPPFDTVTMKPDPPNNPPLLTNQYSPLSTQFSLIQLLPFLVDHTSGFFIFFCVNRPLLIETHLNASVHMSRAAGH